MKKLFINEWKKDYEFLDFKPNVIFLLNRINETDFSDICFKFNNCTIYDVFDLNKNYTYVNKIKLVEKLNGIKFGIVTINIKLKGFNYLFCTNNQIDDSLIRSKIYQAFPKKIFISTDLDEECNIEKKYGIYHIWMGNVFVD